MNKNNYISRCISNPASSHLDSIYLPGKGDTGREEWKRERGEKKGKFLYKKAGKRIARFPALERLIFI